MPRLLVVYQHLPHYRRDLFRTLESTPGWEVHFAAGESSADRGIARVPFEEFAHPHRLRNTWIGPFLWQKGVVRLVAGEWDHVVFLGDVRYLSTWAGAVLARRRGTRVAFWTIGWHRPEGGLRRVVRLMFYRVADQLLLYGEHARRIGTELGYPTSRMAVIGNCSSEPTPSLEETEERLREVSELLVSVHGPAVGAVIRLTPSKRLDMLIDAVSRLQRDGATPVTVVLAGAGPSANGLREEAQSKGVELRLIGPIYGRRALELFYERCLVTVVPTLAGLTTLQSLSHGRPVITHDDPNEQVPEFEAILSGVTGDLYRKGDVDDLARAVEDWVGRVQADPRRVADQCRGRLKGRWTPTSCAERILEALTSKTHPAGRD